MKWKKKEDKLFLVMKWTIYLIYLHLRAAAVFPLPCFSSDRWKISFYRACITVKTATATTPQQQPQVTPHAPALLSTAALRA
ncbi:MAG: hypothetical protein ACOCWT_04765 [Desulfohalobiaceae bacterium]